MTVLFPDCSERDYIYSRSFDLVTRVKLTVWESLAVLNSEVEPIFEDASEWSRRVAR